MESVHPQSERTRFYLSPNLNRGFQGVLEPSLVFSASPNFSVTTHSFTLPASNRPMNVAFVRCSDMTFSKRIQKMIRWNDLQFKIVNQNFLTGKKMTLVFRLHLGG